MHDGTASESAVVLDREPAAGSDAAGTGGRAALTFVRSGPGVKSARGTGLGVPAVGGRGLRGDRARRRSPCSCRLRHASAATSVLRTGHAGRGRSWGPCGEGLPRSGRRCASSGASSVKPAARRRAGRAEPDLGLVRCSTGCRRWKSIESALPLIVYSGPGAEPSGEGPAQPGRRPGWQRRPGRRRASRPPASAGRGRTAFARRRRTGRGTPARTAAGRRAGRLGARGRAGDCGRGGVAGSGHRGRGSAAATPAGAPRARPRGPGGARRIGGGRRGGGGAVPGAAALPALSPGARRARRLATALRRRSARGAARGRRGAPPPATATEHAARRGGRRHLGSPSAASQRNAARPIPGWPSPIHRRRCPTPPATGPSPSIGRCSSPVIASMSDQQARAALTCS